MNCNKCGVELVVGITIASSSYKKQDYLCSSCKSKRTIKAVNKDLTKKQLYEKQYRVANRERVNYMKNLNRIKHAYNLTEEDYLVLMKGNCSICGSSKSKCIDHDHETGEVRGLLCNKCNAGIGLLGDTYDKVQAAANYLRGENE